MFHTSLTALAERRKIVCAADAVLFPIAANKYTGAGVSTILRIPCCVSLMDVSWIVGAYCIAVAEICAHT